MTSVDSIGSCSLDFDASTNYDNYVPNYEISPSAATLKSSRLSPSINGSEKKSPFQNGHMNSGKKISTSDIKLPSYVSISCAINGYTNYSRFCRSRDNSPARGFRKCSLESNLVEEKPLPILDNVRCSRSQSDCNGNSGSIFAGQEFAESRYSTATKKLMTDILLNEEQSFQLPSSSELINVKERHTTEKFLLAKEVGNGETKSLVQQRIESLYGVSAQGKAKLPCRTSRNNDRNNLRKNGNPPKRSPSCPPLALKHQMEKSLPVFRHLTRDFREQLLLDDAMMSESNTVKKNILFKSKQPVLLEEANTKNYNESSRNDISTNGFHSLPPEIGLDECDRVSNTPIPLTKLLPDSTESTKKTDSSLQERDGHAFLVKMDLEKQEIQKLIQHWENELNSDIPEEPSGKIRAVCGQANLLLSQKFEQFRSLCIKNIEENQDVPFYTTESDLAGFWDMVMLQVEDIKSIFCDIHAMKENGWKEMSPEKMNLPKCQSKKPGMVLQTRSNPCTPKRTTKSVELARAREEARKQLIAAKKRGRQQSATTDGIAIFLPPSNQS